MFRAMLQKVQGMNDKLLHTIQLGMLLIVATILILFAHPWLSPEIVFTSMIAGMAGIVGGRIAANGYNSPPPTPGSKNGGLP